jgi:acyl transferase domain-containing protein
MLADLCGVFPEAEEAFAWCDRVAAEAGRPSLRRVLHVPPDASADERAAAEAELRKLGPSIFGVLVADLAVTRVLQHLRLPVAAVAGHSAGELAALLVAGAMRSEEVLGGRLAEIMDVMQRQEDAAGGPDVALLAVGAGRMAVEEAAAAVAGGAVVVAMDNCPHQCVAVGPGHHVAAVETVLAERGLVCERLPFRRPYHCRSSARTRRSTPVARADDSPATRQRSASWP